MSRDGNFKEPASDRARRRFSEIVLLHLDDAYGLALWLTGQRADADDVVQEACIRALAALENATVEQPRAWLLAIVRNCAFTWLAKNRPNFVLVTDDMALLESAQPRDQTPTAEEALIARDDEATLLQAIAELPMPFKEALILRDVNGLSYREIAATTGAPTGTIMSRLARARALLIDKLGKAK